MGKRKGLWSPDEDERLRNYIVKHGHGCWTSVAINAGLQRNGKSCRLRWINYLRPGLKRGAFSMAEEDTIFTLHKVLGNKWSQIAQHLAGRSDNEIKNYWHSYLKKRVAKMEVDKSPNLSLPKLFLQTGFAWIRIWVIPQILKIILVYLMTSTSQFIIFLQSSTHFPNPNCLSNSM